MRINSHFALRLSLCAVGLIGGLYPDAAAAQAGQVITQDDERDPGSDAGAYMALIRAVDDGDTAALKSFAEQDKGLAAIAPDLATLLFHRAARQGSGAVVETLLDMGANIEATDRRGYTPLMLALEANNTEAADALKRRGANLSATAHDGATAQYFASIIGAGGFDLPQSEKTPAVALANADATLLLAAELGNTENVRFALAAGANPAARAKNKWSAMMLAALGSHQEALAVIIDALNAKGSAGAMGDSLRSIADIDLDPIEAAIIGQGGPGKDHARVESVIRYLASAVYGRKWELGREDRYMKAAIKLGYKNPDLARAAFGIRTGGFVLQPSLGPERPSHFLPELEYALPVGPAADQNGWREVQRALREGGATDLQYTGRPDEETLKELLVYLASLVNLVEKRAKEAELRAQEEQELKPDAKQTGAHYGEWRIPSKPSRYIGELYASPKGELRPFGYVVKHNKATDKLSYTEQHFYRAEDDEDDPLCRFARDPRKESNYSLACKILDRIVRIQTGYFDETFVVVAGERGADRVRFDVPKP